MFPYLEVLELGPRDPVAYVVWYTIASSDDLTHVEGPVRPAE
jgi:hypothetical protein